MNGSRCDFSPLDDKIALWVEFYSGQYIGYMLSDVANLQLCIVSQSSGQAQVTSKYFRPVNEFLFLHRAINMTCTINHNLIWV